jgi:hypothetical protein
MKTTIKTTIVSQTDGDNTNNQIGVDNVFIASDDSTDPTTFFVERIINHVFSLKPNNTFSKQLIDVLQCPTEQIKFVNISCYNSTPGEDKTPVQFQITMDTFITKTSLFSIANTDDANTIFADFLIDSIVVATDKIVNLVIVAGIKES